MYKDNFYYNLRDRLEYAKGYAKNYSTYLKKIAIEKKVTKEFYKDKKIVFLLSVIINLPTNIYDYCSTLRGRIGYKKCLKEIEILKTELNKYEQKNI